jgi:type I restriction-modification system DNA methylase subunit
MDLTGLNIDGGTRWLLGYIFEELIRKFAESNSTQAGDHFTPREVIALMVDILFHTADEALTKPGTVRTIYDPPEPAACCRRPTTTWWR